MLPTLTTFVVGVPLTLLPDGTSWWVGFAFAAVVLVIVFLAEYITIDPSAPSYGFARAGLTALAYALFLILATFTFFWRAHVPADPGPLYGCGADQFTHPSSGWHRPLGFPWAIGISIVCAQIGAGLHYWPLTQYNLGWHLQGHYMH
ncbi:MAG: hypothetical protein IPN96_16035 [Anaerolineales bacterium]|nr:hypothetical protein [Anaerolineales bacterium]